MPPGCTSGPKLVTLGLLLVLVALSDESLPVVFASLFVAVGFPVSEDWPEDWPDDWPDDWSVCLGGAVVEASFFAEVLLSSSSGPG